VFGAVLNPETQLFHSCSAQRGARTDALITQPQAPATVNDTSTTTYRLQVRASAVRNEGAAVAHGTPHDHRCDANDGGKPNHGASLGAWGCPSLTDDIGVHSPIHSTENAINTTGAVRTPA
jgi:hypothetical protein